MKIYIEQIKKMPVLGRTVHLIVYISLTYVTSCSSQDSAACSSYHFILILQTSIPWLKAVTTSVLQMANDRVTELA